MSDVDIRWRVMKLEDGTARLEVLVNNVKVGEQSFVKQLDTLMQGMSCQRYQDARLR